MGMSNGIIARFFDTIIRQPSIVKGVYRMTLRRGEVIAFNRETRIGIVENGERKQYTFTLEAKRTVRITSRGTLNFSLLSTQELVEEINLKKKVRKIRIRYPKVGDHIVFVLYRDQKKSQVKMWTFASFWDQMERALTRRASQRNKADGT